MNPTSIKYNGEEHSIEEWSAIYGLNPDTFLESLKNNGFNIDRALNASGQKRERLITFNGKTQNLTQWATELGLPYFCLRSRLNTLKWTVEKAFTTPYRGTKNDK